MFICEGLLNLCGTSSEEIIERTRKEADEYYQPQIDRLSSDNKQLTQDKKLLSSENEYLKLLLKQNNIPFHPEQAGDAD